MTLNEFLLVTPHEVSDYNTNNGWGFGGSRGKKYVFQSGGVILTLKIGKAGTRHMGSFPHTTLWYEDHEGQSRILDLSGHGKRQNDQAIELIKQHLTANAI